MKICISCKQELSLNKFKYESGYQNKDRSKKCKRCIRNSRNKNYRKINRQIRISKMIGPKEWWVKCMEKYNYTCADCGVHNESMRLLVHHIDESRKTGILNNQENNLVVVCCLCHARRHGLVSQKDDVAEMRSAGLTFQEIGNKLGITRQRVQQICKRFTP